MMSFVQRHVCIPLNLPSERSMIALVSPIINDALCVVLNLHPVLPPSHNIMRTQCLLLSFLMLTPWLHGDPPTKGGDKPDTSHTITKVWPEGKMPGKGASEPEAERPSKDAFHRITNVSQPTLTLFPSSKHATPAPAVIVCPGGGYSYVVIDKEGSEIATWLNGQGISALVLKYRNPNNREGALQDLQRALSLTRTNAKDWNIDPKRLGAIGFSAGGHLVAKASNLFEQRSYDALDMIEEQSCRPDFAMLVYPAYLGQDGKVSPELNLKADIPPTLIIHSEDDKNFVPGSQLYHAALQAANITHEFKLYPTGGHGYGLHCTRDAKAWPEDAAAWLRKIGVR